MSVEVDPAYVDTPRAVILNGRRVTVAEVLDTWLVEDEWWRESLARRYLALLLADGHVLTVFCDLVDGGWYLQRYAQAIGNRQ